MRVRRPSKFRLVAIASESAAAPPTRLAKVGSTIGLTGTERKQQGGEGNCS
jgi:hypothetical protein